jgi:hypothetical protein
MVRYILLMDLHAGVPWIGTVPTRLAFESSDKNTKLS